VNRVHDRFVYKYHKREREREREHARARVALAFTARVAREFSAREAESSTQLGKYKELYFGVVAITPRVREKNTLLG